MYSYSLYLLCTIILFSFLSSFFIILLYYHILLFWLISLILLLLILYYFYKNFFATYSPVVLSVGGLILISLCSIFWQFDGFVWIVFIFKQCWIAVSIIQDIDAFFTNCLPAGETCLEQLINFCLLVGELVLGALDTIYFLIISIINFI